MIAFKKEMCLTHATDDKTLTVIISGTSAASIFYIPGNGIADVKLSFTTLENWMSCWVINFSLLFFFLSSLIMNLYISLLWGTSIILMNEYDVSTSVLFSEMHDPYFFNTQCGAAIKWGGTLHENTWITINESSIWMSQVEQRIFAIPGLKHYFYVIDWLAFSTEIMFSIVYSISCTAQVRRVMRCSHWS